ncbi:JAB domain-containing protein [Sphingomonas quercus]|uniref:DNA repair protein n=1 Tax=Sphingomonas quercus TaxID=2842451 RepID=A0ABS6BHE7_9SPHN|nr:JAB domain-containing protein [Sphingomonas quercus]MBU3077732.1 DNA repair protein [Sphingomonas quercus]
MRSAADAVTLLGPALAHRDKERVHAAYVAECGLVLAVDEVEGLSCAWIDLPIRHLIGRTLQLGGVGIVIAHNHPSGDPAPSAHDIAATRALANAARVMDIRLLDHLIFARSHCASFRALGLL